MVLSLGKSVGIASHYRVASRLVACLVAAFSLGRCPSLGKRTLHVRIPVDVLSYDGLSFAVLSA